MNGAPLRGAGERGINAARLPVHRSPFTRSPRSGDPPFTFHPHSLPSNAPTPLQPPSSRACTLP